MQIGGFRIQVTGVPESHAGAASAPRRRRPHRNGSADTTCLSWLLLDPDPEAQVTVELQTSVGDGSYSIPAPEVSRRLVDDHVTVKLRL